MKLRTVIKQEKKELLELVETYHATKEFPLKYVLFTGLIEDGQERFHNFKLLPAKNVTIGVFSENSEVKYVIAYSTIDLNKTGEFVFHQVDGISVFRNRE